MKNLTLFIFILNFLACSSNKIYKNKIFTIHNTMYSENKIDNRKCDLNQIIQKQYDPEKYQEIENKDIVVVLGNSGVGKSTVLNLLLGHKLKKNKHVYEVEKKLINNVFKIGHGFSNTTLEPQFKEQESGMIYVDLPGIDINQIDENLGIENQLMNAIYLKNIFTKAKSVKFIFMATQASFEESRAEGFKNFQLILEKIISNNLIQDIFDNSIFILTKTNVKCTKIFQNILPINKNLNLLFHTPNSQYTDDFMEYQKSLKTEILNRINLCKAFDINNNDINVLPLLNENFHKHTKKVYKKELNKFVKNTKKNECITIDKLDKLKEQFKIRLLSNQEYLSFIQKNDQLLFMHIQSENESLVENKLQKIVQQQQQKLALALEASKKDGINKRKNPSNEQKKYTPQYDNYNEKEQLALALEASRKDMINKNKNPRNEQKKYTSQYNNYNEKEQLNLTYKEREESIKKMYRELMKKKGEKVEYDRKNEFMKLLYINKPSNTKLENIKKNLRSRLERYKKVTGKKFNPYYHEKPKYITYIRDLVGESWWDNEY